MSYPGVRSWLVEHTSLEPSLLEGAGFEALVAERLSAAGGGDESRYVAVLEHSADEVDRLTGGIAVPETWFFRYPQSFALLVDFLRHRLGSGANSLRMRSIGCASGEEPYGMAMAALHAGWPADVITVEAFDRHGGILRKAAAGEYGSFSIRTEIPGWAIGFLDRSGETIVVDAQVRRLVRFVRMDALHPDPTWTSGICDVVFCRNLLIYLGADARVRLLESICASLAPGGMLFVGHAEQLLCGALPLRQIAEPHAFALERVETAAVQTASTPRVVGATRQPMSARRPLVAAGPLVEHPVFKPRVDAPNEPTLAEACNLADAGRAGESEAMVRTIIARRGPSAGAMELLGMIRMASSDLGAAKVYFEQAVYLEPNRAASLLQLAMLCERSGDARRAAVLWDRARRASAEGGQERTR